MVSFARTKPPHRQWSVCYDRRTTIVSSSEAACACRLATLHYSRSSSTPFVRLPRLRRLPSIRGPTIAPMLPPDGWRLEVETYSPATNKKPVRGTHCDVNSRNPPEPRPGQTRIVGCDCLVSTTIYPIWGLPINELYRSGPCRPMIRYPSEANLSVIFGQKLRNPLRFNRIQDICRLFP